MANADFNADKAGSGAAGFDAGSYRAKKAAPAGRTLSPNQKALAALEKKLPAVLKNGATAMVLAVALLAASVFGAGGAKLSAQYHKAADSFTVGVAADNGYTMAEELTARGNNAANILTSAGHINGLDGSYITVTQGALDKFNAAMDAGDVSDIYDADAALTAAVDQLYAAMQAKSADPLNMGAVQSQYSEFTSAGTVMGHMAYNEAAERYNDTARGFPANIIGALWGVQEVELFA